MMATSRPRPTIHINGPQLHHYNDLSFRHPPRKRKWSSNDSSEDDDFGHGPYHMMYNQHASNPQRAPESLSPTTGPQSPVGGGNESSEGEHKHKRTKKSVPPIERGMGNMSLYAPSNIQRGPHNSPQQQVITPPGVHTAYSTLYSRPIVQESGSYHPTWNYPLPNSSYIVSEPDHLDIDQEFIPREHGHEQDLVLPDIEEVPQTPQTYSSMHNLQRQSINNGDIKMSSSSWYEPEKDREYPSVQSQTTATPVPLSRPCAPPNRSTGIIITDLDDSDDEVDNISSSKSASAQSQSTDKGATYWDEDEQRFKTFEVSPAYLARFGRVPKAEDITGSISGRREHDSLALVAYHPPPIIPRPPPIWQSPDAVEEVEEQSDEKPNSEMDNLAEDAGDMELMDLDD
ncbi:hypothetical protein FRC18_001076 [Serendipita sp. 400]|nr:hypothetical protein FRC18_001076 [Serendipita sp. 400]